VLQLVQMKMTLYQTVVGLNEQTPTRPRMGDLPEEGSSSRPEDNLLHKAHIPDDAYIALGLDAVEDFNYDFTP
jgi:hypothetical protein